MPYKRKRPVKKRAVKRNKVAAYRKRQGRAVRSHPKQIQSASWVPQRRLVLFTDTRVWSLKDNEGTLSSFPPTRAFPCNDPTTAFTEVYKNGTWSAVSLTAKGAGVPAIAKWVTNVNGTGTGDYRAASAISAKIQVTVTPMPRDGTADTYQDCAQVILQRSTGLGTVFHNQVVSNTFNAEVTKQLPFTKSAMIYSNFGGTPRGCTISDSYSFSSMNALKTAAQNIFCLDGLVTSERDTWCLAILPGDSAGYGSGGNRITDMRVEVKISYVVALSEPSTNFSQLNEGIALGGGIASFAGLGLADSGLAAE